MLYRHLRHLRLEERLTARRRRRRLVIVVIAGVVHDFTAFVDVFLQNSISINIKKTLPGERGRGIKEGWFGCVTHLFRLFLVLLDVIPESTRAGRERRRREHRHALHSHHREHRFTDYSPQKKKKSKNQPLPTPQQ